MAKSAFLQFDVGSYEQNMSERVDKATLKYLFSRLPYIISNLMSLHIVAGML